MKNNAAEKLKQVPGGYLILGVDPHKKKHAAVVMTQDAVVQYISSLLTQETALRRYCTGSG